MQQPQIRPFETEDIDQDFYQGFLERRLIIQLGQTLGRPLEPVDVFLNDIETPLEAVQLRRLTLQIATDAVEGIAQRREFAIATETDGGVFAFVGQLRDCFTQNLEPRPRAAALAPPRRATVPAATTARTPSPPAASAMTASNLVPGL